MGNRMVPFSGTGLCFIFRLFDVEVALCVTTAARRAAEFSTEELARKDRISDSDRISKIRARLYLRLEESYNYPSRCYSVKAVCQWCGVQVSGQKVWVTPPAPAPYKIFLSFRSLA